MGNRHEDARGHENNDKNKRLKWDTMMRRLGDRAGGTVERGGRSTFTS